MRVKFSTVRSGVFAFSLCLMLGIHQPALSQETSPYTEPLKALIGTLDSGAKYRDDSLVTFNDGLSYVLVAPAEMIPVEHLQVAQRIPEQGPVSDIIAFNDGHFLLRIITLPNGRKSFPIPQDIPVALRSGLLSQNFNFPEGFLLPTAWKSLTGNLLDTPESASVITKSYPLAVLGNTGKSVYLWDVAKNQSLKHFSLSCKPADMVVSHDAQHLLVGCASEAKLYAYSLSDEKVQTYDLPAPVGKMVLDGKGTRLYLSHPTVAKLSYLDLTDNTPAKFITLRHPVNQLVISPFRKQLIAATVPPTAADLAKEAEQAAPVKKGFFAGPEKPKADNALSEHKAGIIRGPSLQLINLVTLGVEKYVPALPDLSDLYIQDEKVLWMISRTDNTLQPFDLRWQEYGAKIPLAEVPVAMQSDDDWLYLLFPKSATLQRLSMKTLQWGDPIVLEQASAPSSFVLDEAQHQVYILSAERPGVQVVSLDRGEWVGTEKTDFQGTGRMAWVIPADAQAKPGELVRIKFQDGRLMLQNAQGHQWEKSLSDLNAPPKTQTPQGHSKTKSNHATK